MSVSCCGQAKDQPGVVANTQPFLGAGPGIIDSQPTYKPVPNYNTNGFQPPTVPSPPIAHPHDYNPFSNGLQPPMREFGATSPSHSIGHSFSGTTFNGRPPSQQHTFTGTTYTGQREFGASSPPHQQTPLPTFTASNFNSINQSVTRPKSFHAPNSPPPKVKSPIQDEGKMSVSIDFGVYPL